MRKYCLYFEMAKLKSKNRKNEEINLVGLNLGSKSNSVNYVNAWKILLYHYMILDKITGRMQFPRWNPNLNVYRQLDALLEADLWTTSWTRTTSTCRSGRGYSSTMTSSSGPRCCSGCLDLDPISQSNLYYNFVITQFSCNSIKIVSTLGDFALTEQRFIR